MPSIQAALLFEPDDGIRDEHIYSEDQLRACVTKELQEYSRKCGSQGGVN